MLVMKKYPDSVQHSTVFDQLRKHVFNERYTKDERKKAIIRYHKHNKC